MRRRQVLAAIGGGIIVGSARGAAKGPPSNSGPPNDRYTGPMHSAHEHLLFMPEGGLDFLVDWMEANDWERIVGFATPELLDKLENHPNRFVPFDQAPFSRYALSRLNLDISQESFPPYLPEPDDSVTLETLAGEFERSLVEHDGWKGIGEISFRIIHRLEGDFGFSRPDADWAMDVYEVAADNDATVMIHPPHPAQLALDEPKDPRDHPIIEGLRNVFEAFPRTKFLVHGISKAELLDAVNPLLEEYDNWMYDVSGLMFGHPEFWTLPGLSEQEISNKRAWLEDELLGDHIEEHVRESLSVWEDILSEHPDRVLWGTDAGRPWHFYDQYFELKDRLYRTMLGRLPHADATKIAHANARKFLH